MSTDWHADRVPAHHELIRPAQPEDAERVWPLVREFATSFTPERTAFDRTWQQAVVAADTLVLVAETVDGAIIGYLLGHRHHTFFANGPVAWVEELMVERSHRRSGVGRRLMEHAEDWARSTDAAYLALASRRAGHFYLALGYEDSAVFYKNTLR
jgi:GNAT superfamily N-acetyltransferase